MKMCTLALSLSALFTMVIALSGCESQTNGPGGGSNGPSSGSNSTLQGSVKIDGSSTVFPISAAVAEEFENGHEEVSVNVAFSGTGDGFKKFCVGDTDINDASRPVKDKEIVKAAENAIEFIELPVAYDGLSILVNPKNDFVDYLSVEELKKIWQPESTVKNWSDIRKEWPEKPIKFYAPGVASGTFDYFTETINGKSGACRKSEVSFSEDDNMLVTGIAGDEMALGFFGFAYYNDNKDKLKLVPVKSAEKPVAPSKETINNGTYAPLSRPIFIYVSTQAADRPEVDAFVKFYLENSAQLAEEVGYIALPAPVIELAKLRYSDRKTGSALTGKETEGKTLEQMYSAE